MRRSGPAHGGRAAGLHRRAQVNGGRRPRTRRPLSVGGCRYERESVARSSNRAHPTRRVQARRATLLQARHGGLLLPDRNRGRNMSSCRRAGGRSATGDRTAHRTDDSKLGRRVVVRPAGPVLRRQHRWPPRPDHRRGSIPGDNRPGPGQRVRRACAYPPGRVHGCRPAVRRGGLPAACASRPPQLLGGSRSGQGLPRTRCPTGSGVGTDTDDARGGRVE